MEFFLEQLAQVLQNLWGFRRAANAEFVAEVVEMQFEDSVDSEGWADFGGFVRPMVAYFGFVRSEVAYFDFVRSEVAYFAIAEYLKGAGLV